MKSTIPYSKEIRFGSKICEICSISLEHELHINENDIHGNFIVSGEYKSHEVSVNKESFSYKLPFSVEVTDTIIKDSIHFEITDFTYEIIDEEILKVNIQFEVTALENKKEEIVEEVEKLFLEPEEEEEIEESLEDEADREELKMKMEEEEVIEKEEPIEEERLDAVSEELIMDSAKSKEDEFTTYYIHLVKMGDTVETICMQYQTDVEVLKMYNDIEHMTIGDKIIIPSIDE